MSDPTHHLPPGLAAQIIQRVSSPEWDRFNTMIHAAGYCAQPVRLKGRVLAVDADTGHATLDYSTAHEPDRVLLKACGTRRATRCPACAAVYRVDARILIIAGLAGGKGVPPDIAQHPAVFATLTAPSYGAVHTTRRPPGPCHPAAGSCPHGQTRECHLVHEPADERVGAPICGDCYDYVGAVMFNARVNDLWRRTAIHTRRALAAHLRLGVRQLSDHHRLAFIKVVEHQARGVVHVHALLRADPTHPHGAHLGPGVLVAAVNTAARRAAAPNPQQPKRPIRWGTQHDIRVIDNQQRRAAANYLAKYATKSTDPDGALDHRLRSDDLTGLHLPPHIAAMARTAWDLGGQPHLAHLNLRLWAHTLGYRGHWLTKSRGWSTTFTDLRTARRHWQLTQRGHPIDDPNRHAQWDYQGIGHTTPGDAWLAEVAHQNKTLNRRTAWEEK